MPAPLRQFVDRTLGGARERARRDVTRASVQAGLRAAAATAAPLVLAYTIGRPELVLAGVGGWLTSIADPGGAPRPRAQAMVVYLVLGALAYGGGVLAGALPALPLALAVAVVAALGGLLRVGGDVGATLGTLAAATFCAALATPVPAGLTFDARWVLAAAGAALLAAGSAWAMVLAFVVWPARPYGAAREAAAGGYRALASFSRATGEALAAALAVPDRTARTARFTDLAQAEHPRVRAAIETGRQVLLDTRRGRLGGSRRADHVAVLLDEADALFLALLTAAEAAEVAAGAAADDSLLADDAPELARAFALFGGVLDDVAAAVPDARRAERAPRGLPALDAALVPLVEDDTAAGDRRGRDALRHAAAVLEQAAGQAERAAETAAALAADAPDAREVASARGAVVAARWAGRSASRRGAAWLRTALRPDRATARHALRLGVAVGAAQLLGAWLHVARGPWITITTLVLLQPSAGLTVRRSAARVVGTVAGGALAAVLAAGLRDPRLIAAAAFVLVGASMALRAVHYGVFTFFLTPVVVLLAQPAPGDWSLAGVRVVDTLLGGAVAVLGGVLLWPAWEAAALPATAAEVVAAARAHAALAFRAALGDPLGDPLGDAAPDESALLAARRRAGLAATVGEGALERLLAEPRGRDAGEALLVLLARARRLNSAAAALAGFGGADGAGGPAAGRLAALGAGVDALLADVEAAARGGRAPGEPPAAVARLLDDARGPGEVGRTAERRLPELPAWGTAVRVARQADGLRVAAGRLFGVDGAAGGA